MIKGDGTPYRSYLYAADLAIWLWMILLRGQSCQSYNVGSENSLSINQLAHTISQKFKPAIKVTKLNRADPQKAPERYVAAINHARDELGLQEWIILDDAITRTIRWYQSNHNLV